MFEQLKAMTSKHLAQRHSKLTCLITFLWVSILSYPLSAEAHLRQPLGNQITHSSNLIAQKVPSNLDAPNTGRRRGGTSRDNGCPKEQTDLTALVPGDKSGNKSKLSSTVAEFPSFWVSLPRLPQNIDSGEFVLQDKEGEDIYRTNVELPQKSGVMGVNLPKESKYALKEGEKYQWYFKVFCGNADTSPEYFYVSAWVQRVAVTPALKQELEANKSQQYKVYAKNNIVYDAISNLAAFRAVSPNSTRLTEDWKQLLTSLGLQELVDEPIVKIANAKK